MRLFTVGHSSRTLDELFAVLRAHGIVTLCDVRAFPASKRHPQFDRDALHAAWGDGYVWLGQELGGYRDEGYDRHMESDAFEAGIARLTALGARAPTACMCAERHFQGCHRRFISDHLVERGVEVFHIVDESAPLQHPGRQLELF